MKAARLHEYQGQLQWDDVPEPVISGPQDVIVRVDAAGVCRTDLNILDGQLDGVVDVELPYILGHETAGYVHAVGSDVTNVKVGDPVAMHPLATCGQCRPCRAGDDMHCVDFLSPGINCDGGFAEYAWTNSRGVIKLDEGVTPIAVAALTDAGLTAYHACKKASKVLYPGARVAVFGIGGLGHIGIQCLRALTASEIIAVDPNEGALELGRNVGADYAIKSDGTHVEQIMKLTGGKGVEVIVDFAGKGGAIEDGLEMLAERGHYYHVGYGDNVNTPAVRIVVPEISLIGNFQGGYNELEELLYLNRKGIVDLEITEYPFSAVNEVLEELKAGNIRGRGILVRPEGDRPFLAPEIR